MSEENEPSNKDNKSVFNQAEFQMKRLDTSWQLCKIYIDKGKFSKWDKQLKTIELELETDIKSDREELNELNKKIKVAKFSFLKSYDSWKETYGFKEGGTYESLLEDKHRLLKNIEHKSGKGAVYSDRTTNTLGI